MNPLFKHATKTIKAAALATFRAGKVGRLTAALDRYARRGGVSGKLPRGIPPKLRRRANEAIKRSNGGRMSPSFLAQLGEIFREIDKVLADDAKKAFGRTVLGRVLENAAGPVQEGRREFGRRAQEQYARKRQNEQDALDRMFRAFGPLGDLLKTFIRPAGKSLAAANPRRELEAAVNLARAFGFTVIPPPSRKGGKKATIAQMAEYLGKQGFKLVPTVEFQSTIDVRPGQPKPEKSPRYKPLPGWATRAHQMQAPPATGLQKPERVRKTIDVDFGEGKKRRVKLTDPILTGEMIKVVSSNVHSIGFDINQHSPMIGTLKVRFLQSFGASAQGAKVAGALYYYYNVPSDLFKRFTRAASKGKWVWDNLRKRGTVSGHKFDYSLTGISRGYVPRKATYSGHEGEIFEKRVFLGQNTRTGERRLFQSKETALARPSLGRPDNGRPDNGRSGNLNRG